MNVTVTTTARFHSFDLARQMIKKQMLTQMYTAYPRRRVVGEGIPVDLLTALPYTYAPYAVARRLIRSPRFSRSSSFYSHRAFARAVARRLDAPTILTGMSSTNVEAALRVKDLGGYFVCRRGSSHILHQNEILREEHEKWKLPWVPTDPRIVERELQEYEIADGIVVPSIFALESFSSHGVSSEKIWKIPYGVDLSRFKPSGEPSVDEFNVLFVGESSVRKGLPYLLSAFASLQHPKKKLTVIGATNEALVKHLVDLGVSVQNVEFLGPVPQARLSSFYSRAHVLVLPSIEDGFGAVMAQAMAAGCPVIATESTGGPDLIADGGAGYVVPPADSAALAEAMRRVDSVDWRDLRSASLARVRALAGWDTYGDALANRFAELTSAGGTSGHM